MPRYLTALPVYNEAAHVTGVLDEVVKFTPDVLVVDDGSTDGTTQLVEDRAATQRDILVVRHPGNRGYGAALSTAFREALAGGWDGLVTIDCDGQHQPQLIPQFVAEATAVDGPVIISGSRYLRHFEGDDKPPEARRRINAEITADLNRRFGLGITDAFCGFKAYSRKALELIAVTETGYAMPLEAWVQAAARGITVRELPVPLVYLDETRSFGGALDDAATRLAYYRQVLDRAEATAKPLQHRPSSHPS